MIKYLDKIETEFENTFACLSGAQLGLNHKKLKVENLVTLPSNPNKRGIPAATK